MHAPKIYVWSAGSGWIHFAAGFFVRGVSEERFWLGKLIFLIRVFHPIYFIS